MRAQAMTIVVAAIILGGCGQQWQQARTALSVSEGCIDAINGAVPGAREELDMVRASITVGYELVDIWQASGEEPSGWQKILGEVAHAVLAATQLIKEAGIDVPGEVDQALQMLALLTGYGGER